MPRKLPLKLFLSLVPALIVSTFGIALLGQIATPIVPAPAPAVTMPIKAEMEFHVTRDERAAVAEDRDNQAEAADAKTTAKTKRVAAKPTPRPSKPTVEELQQRQMASASPVQPLPAPPQSLAPPSPPNNGVMAKIRGVTATVGAIPFSAARHVAGWFSPSAPPRPPADIPSSNFFGATM